MHVTPAAHQTQGSEVQGEANLVLPMTPALLSEDVMSHLETTWMDNTSYIVFYVGTQGSEEEKSSFFCQQRGSLNGKLILFT